MFIPNVDRKDVLRVICRDFSTEDCDRVLSELDKYQAGSSFGTVRVQMAILKLAKGRMDEVRRHVRNAMQDFRDELAAAENPRLLKIGFVEYGKLKEDQRAKLKQEDQQEYEAWLAIENVRVR